MNKLTNAQIAERLLVIEADLQSVLTDPVPSNVR
jgi:hypothetical protein